MNKGDFALCCLTVIPVRDEPKDASEMISQLLFGEMVRILDIHNQWLKIENLHDKYAGWVDKKQLLSIPKEDIQLLNSNAQRQQDNELIIQTPWGLQKVLQGSLLPSKKKTFNLGTTSFQWEQLPAQINNKSIIELANDYINAPYLWGGRTKYGIDCSGLTQTIYQQKGYTLSRDASQQVLEGKQVPFNEHRPGDLAFFASEKTGKITHVGIILKHAQIIHAHGRVRIDTIDTKGIYDKEKDAYSHQLHSINRYKTEGE